MGFGDERCGECGKAFNKEQENYAVIVQQIGTPLIRRLPFMKREAKYVCEQCNEH